MLAEEEHVDGHGDAEKRGEEKGDDGVARAEVAGIKTLIDGIRASTKDDAARIGRGTEVFNDLYEFFRRKRR